MRTIAIDWLKANYRYNALFIVVIGCLFITFCSLIKIPFFPVSFTLQTLAIYYLALTTSPRLAFLSTITYLCCATVGLPVLCGHSNSLWFIGKSAGYLMGFPIAAYLIAKVSTKKHPVFALLGGQAVIFLLGFLWLLPLVGANVAWMKGVVFFIPSELLKGLIAFVWARKSKEKELV